MWICGRIRRGFVLDFSRPSKLTDNAFIESFNGKFRAEYLNTHWFLSLDDARLKMEAWRRDYNEVRPHSALGQKTPLELLICSGASDPARANAIGNPPAGQPKDG